MVLIWTENEHIGCNGYCNWNFPVLPLRWSRGKAPPRERRPEFDPLIPCGVYLLVACLTSQQHASVSQGRICTDNFTCCHIEIEGADQTFYLTQLQYTDTGPTSPSADPIMPGSWQGSHWSAPRGAFSKSIHTSDSQTGTRLATLLGAWRYGIGGLLA